MSFRPQEWIPTRRSPSPSITLFHPLTVSSLSSTLCPLRISSVSGGVSTIRPRLRLSGWKCTLVKHFVAEVDDSRARREEKCLVSPQCVLCQPPPLGALVPIQLDLCGGAINGVVYLLLGWARGTWGPGRLLEK